MNDQKKKEKLTTSKAYIRIGANFRVTDKELLDVVQLLFWLLCMELHMSEKKY
jgi:hypothetical protein